MSARPSFQFYPKDWRTDANLRRCSPAARGVWLDVMCVLHDSDEYGLVRYPLKELAGAAGASMPHVRELVDKYVLRGVDQGTCEPCVYTPKHGRREGPAVALVEAQAGPIWYSKRMVKDEYVRTVRGEGTRFGDEGGPSPKEARNLAPNPPFGDGPSSSSSSSTPVFIGLTSSGGVRTPDGAETPPTATSGIPNCDHQAVLELWAALLPAHPQPKKWTTTRKAHLQARWRELFAEGKAHNREDALAWFAKYFRWVGTSAFLTGRTKPTGDRPPFIAQLDWLLLPDNLANVIEGKYHPEA